MGNYYRILGLRPDATDEEIKAAYKKLALAHNPKRYRPRPALTPSEHAQEQLMREQAEQLESLQIFMYTAEAYDVLSDPLRKAIFDQFGERALKEGLPGPDGFISAYAYHGDPFRTFREFFGTDNPFADLMASACTPSDMTAAKDVHGFLPKDIAICKPLSLTMEEVYNGAIKKLIITKKVAREDGVTYETRDKVLTVKVPPGAPQGMMFTFPNEGDQGPKIQPADVILYTQIEKHPIYEREQNNLIMTMKVNLYEAMCGVLIPIKTLDGRSFKVYNVHMIQPGYEKILVGEGMPILGQPGKKGDLIIRFNVAYPNKLTEAQKKLVRQALDPSKSKGKSAYDRIPPATFTVSERCVCPPAEEAKRASDAAASAAAAAHVAGQGLDPDNGPTIAPQNTKPPIDLC